LLEGLEETFIVNRLGFPPTLRRCLCTTNIIESPHSGVRIRTRRGSRWRNQKMVMYWAASAWSETRKSFRRIQGYRDLRILKSVLDEDFTKDKFVQEREVGQIMDEGAAIRASTTNGTPSQGAAPILSPTQNS